MTDRKTRPEVEAALAEIDLIESRTFLPRNDPDYFTGRQQREALRATLTKLVDDAVEAFGNECEKFCEDLSRGHSYWPNSVHAVIATIQYEIRARAGGSDA